MAAAAAAAARWMACGVEWPIATRTTSNRSEQDFFNQRMVAAQYAEADTSHVFHDYPNSKPTIRPATSFIFLQTSKIFLSWCMSWCAWKRPFRFLLFDLRVCVV